MRRAEGGSARQRQRSQGWWVALERLKQGCEFEANLGYVCSKTLFQSTKYNKMPQSPNPTIKLKHLRPPTIQNDLLGIDKGNPEIWLPVETEKQRQRKHRIKLGWMILCKTNSKNQIKRNENCRENENFYFRMNPIWVRLLIYLKQMAGPGQTNLLPSCHSEPRIPWVPKQL